MSGQQDKVTSYKHILGNMEFRPVELELTPKLRNGEEMGVYWGPGLAMHPVMATGEARSPIIFVPQMILPLITQFAHWGSMISGDGQAPPTSDAPVSETAATENTDEGNPLARRPGESRGEWDDRLARMRDDQG